MTTVKKTLYVGGLDDNVTVDTLRGAFIPFGEIRDISLPLDYKTRMNRIEFIINKSINLLKRIVLTFKFDTREDALDAVDNMHDSEIFGRTINCTIAKQSTVDKNKSQMDHQQHFQPYLNIYHQVATKKSLYAIVFEIHPRGESPEFNPALFLPLGHRDRGTETRQSFYILFREALLELGYSNELYGMYTRECT
ncbi:hypothetical protein PPL_03459 [Heterostelium album PN500]|uniref:RRM domain-containing protein n=1 Tax=Heterostelium pallidum (strain ATCC 26659 / Pp 5 / PN500) TaxID=670386 RepID=D3B4Y3_HETP5|nr:hypothetical protein PPL_03459 [Heterostelium album PN500]EFA84381.1 hypothetical protein PPL_03459 [Heterostelium album PN500]|eukprot:XP_020436496.1 hypothetical protein PPL_03459 [Heterostelium album PN500]